MTDTARVSNPTGASLLDRSTAHPGSIDKSIFEKKSGTAAGSAIGQGTVNSNYLRECREDNPEPVAQDEQAGSVVLSNCKITTPPDKLVVDQPFEMAIDAKASAGSASGEVSFRLFCTVPTENGQTRTEDQSLSFSGKVSEGVASASGKLISPKTLVAAGTKLQYHVVAEHSDAKEKCESPKVEVEAGKPPQPLAVWTLGAIHFGFGSSFVLPTAVGQVAELKKTIDSHPGAAVAVFGHADPVGDDEANKLLSGRRAHALYCLLTRQVDGWQELSKGVDGDKWDLRATQTMLAHLKDGSGAPYYKGAVDGKNGPVTEGAIKAFQNANGLEDDGIAGPKTHEKLYRSYMDGICEVSLECGDFVGDPQDTKRQWACVGCGEFNPVLVFDKSQEDAFAKSSDKSERNAKNAPNRRATVFLFPPGAKGPGNVTFPCPQWSEGIASCKSQLFPDADTRRNPTDAERTWEKDKDTFACKFYAQLGKGEWSHGNGGTKILNLSLGSVYPEIGFAVQKYAFECAGQTICGDVPGDGNLALQVPDDATEATLKLDPDTEGGGLVWKLALSGIPPVEDAKGMQIRLNNLGFFCGAEDGVIGKRTKVGLRAFQQHYELSVTGEADEATLAKIKETYGG